MLAFYHDVLNKLVFWVMKYFSTHAASGERGFGDASTETSEDNIWLLYDAHALLKGSVRRPLIDTTFFFNILYCGKTKIP